MSKMIQLRHVPDALHRTLRARAQRAGMPLSDYLRRELERTAQQLTMAELRDRLDALEPVHPKAPPATAVRHERGRR